MSSSWGQKIEQMDAETTACHARQGWGCERKCGQPATHFFCYRYVTGRAGRVSAARKARCLACAEKALAKALAATR